MGHHPILRGAVEDGSALKLVSESDEEGVQSVIEWQELAPEIYRQRLVVEGTPAGIIDALKIQEYLLTLSSELGMKTLLTPVTHQSDKYGWAGWIHWECSGAHFYAWEMPYLFFSVDIYTCKCFDIRTAVAFTQRFFAASKTVARAF